MKNFIGLYVDDLRSLPEGYLLCEWDIARSYDEAISKLETHNYEKLSLDHDIASFYGGREKTGYDIALWLAQRKHDGLYVPTDIFVHSANPVGAANINAVINRYLIDE